MKILHVITSLRTGGAEKLLVDLLPRLKACGYDIELLLFDGTETHLRREIEESGIKVYDLGIGGSVYSPLKFFKLLPFFKKYNIIHTHNTAPQLFVAIASLFNKVQLITTEHGGSNRRRSWKWYKPIDRWMYNRYKKIICISEKGRDNLCQFIGKSRSEIITINNGIDVAKFANSKSSILLEDTAPGSRKLIMVAGFRWEKDQPTVIKALKHLPDNFHLFLVGGGARRDELMQLAKDESVKERVHFLGIRNDVPKLLHAADYVVMSSHFEGLSLSSVEGMCVGRPFVASDVDGLREVVKDAGILFPHEDFEALANSIIQLENSKDKYDAVCHSCRRQAQKFDIAQTMYGYAKVYNSIE